MNVLWIVNIVFPEVHAMLKGSGTLRASGGWIVSTAEELVKYPDVNLTVISVSSNVKNMMFLEGEKIHYILIPFCRNPKNYSYYYAIINEKVKPKVVHIHGTEYPYGWAWLQTMPCDNVVVSIQGLISVIAKYYRAGLSLKDIYTNITFHDLLRHSVIGEQQDFYTRGEVEQQVLRKVNHVIGRTSFDKAHCMAINPKVDYHLCNETLRPEFYSGQWAYENCRPHSIFMSQASYPIKGLHMLIKAMPLVLKEYPDAILRVAGKDITRRSDINTKLRFTGYGNYLHKLINKYKLEDKITFLGPLDAEEMKREYLKTNVFVSPSAIENSPNSIGEAQLLGVPVVASFVGGVMDMMKGDESNLYRYEEYEMMARKICSIFSKRAELPQLLFMQEQARKRHNVNDNIMSLMTVYNNL